jgi:hypothetical protein
MVGDGACRDARNRCGIVAVDMIDSVDGVETFTFSAGSEKGICGLGKLSKTFAVAFDSSGSIYASADSGGVERVDVFPSGQNNCKKPQRTISDGGERRAQTPG